VNRLRPFGQSGAQAVEGFEIACVLERTVFVHNDRRRATGGTFLHMLCETVAPLLTCAE
jgi:hypothetical protein